ncbi:MAG TPA: twin-arginine translocation signal domain-containing protein [Anaerolineales bacterium]
MSISRRDFMKLVGVSVASLALTRCRIPLPVSCYASMPPSPYPTEPPLTVKDRLRLCWLRFGELAQATKEESTQGITENTFGQQLVTEHRLALDEFVTAGELTPKVADLIQDAYDAAVYHVWRSNAPMTCYAPMIVDYAPVSAGVLVQQSEVLSEVANENTIDPETLAKAQIALEHDMAFYALTDEEVASLYDRLITEWQSQQQTAPAFENLELEITPDAKAAAQFIISLLTSK